MVQLPAPISLPGKSIKRSCWMPPDGVNTSAHHLNKSSRKVITVMLNKPSHNKLKGRIIYTLLGLKFYPSYIWLRSPLAQNDRAQTINLFTAHLRKCRLYFINGKCVKLSSSGQRWLIGLRSICGQRWLLLRPRQKSRRRPQTTDGYGLKWLLDLFPSSQIIYKRLQKVISESNL